MFFSRRLNKHQRRKIADFVRSTGAAENDASRILAENKWVLLEAIEDFYERQKLNDKIQRETLFQQFREPDSDVILANGIERLCQELQVDPQDIVMLVLSWRMKAAAMCEFTRHEFTWGLEALGVNSIDGLRDAIPFLRAELRDDGKFSSIYNFAFDWAREESQKSLTIETAVGLWRILLAEKAWPYLDQWCEFIQNHHRKSIPKDTWTLLLEFASTVDPMAADYDSSDGWPSAIDEFVEYVRKGGGGDSRGGTMRGSASSSNPSSSSIA
ncbi:uncharacterized protein LOC144702040 [Wolffia australiana]